MRRPLSILILALFIIPLIPLMTTTITKATISSPVRYDTSDTPSDFSLIVRGTKAVISWTGHNSKDLRFRLNDTTTATEIANNLAVSDGDSYHISSASNGTAFMIVDEYSGYKLKGYVFSLNDGSQLGYLEIDTSGNVSRAYVAGTTGYWLVTYTDKEEYELNMTLIDANTLNIIYTTTLGKDTDTPSGAYVVAGDNEFLILWHFQNGTYDDMVAWLVEPGNPPTITRFNLTNTPSTGEGFTSTIAYIDSVDKFIVAFTEYSGILHYMVIDPNTKTIEYHGTLPCEEKYAYPSIADGDGYWLITYTYHSDEARAVLFSTSDWATPIVTHRFFSVASIRPVYDGTDFVVVWLDDVTNGKFYAKRIGFDGKISSSTLEIDLTGLPNAISSGFRAASDDNGRIVMAFKLTGDPYYGYWMYFDYTDVPEPTAIPVNIKDVTVSFTDNNGNGLLDAGDTITVTGTVEDTAGNAVIGATVTGTLMYYYYQDGPAERTGYPSASDDTDTSGQFTITLTVPSSPTLLSGSHVVKLVVGDPYSGEELSSVFIIYPAEFTKTLDGSLTDWATIPTDIEPGPAIMYINGEFVITDPENDTRKDIAVIPSTELSDLDIRQARIAIDQNYLYLAFQVEGIAENDSTILPLFGVAVDLTPKDTSDGFQAGKNNNFWLFWGSNKRLYSDVSLIGKRGWHFTATVVADHEALRELGFSEIPVMLYIYDGSWIRRVFAGKAVFNGGTVEVAIPWDVIKAITGISTITGMAVDIAVFPYSVENMTIAWGVDYANFVDVPGIPTVGALGNNPLFTHPVANYTNYDLGTEFIVNVDEATPKLYGYTIAYITATNVTINSDVYFYDGVKGFVGTTGYLVRIVDANSTVFSKGLIYGIYGKSLSLSTTDGLTGTVGTTNGTGFAFAKIVYPDNSTRNITIEFAGDSDYISYTKTYKDVNVMYLLNITYFNIELIDNNGNNIVDKGDQLKISVKVECRDASDNWVTPPNGLPVVIKIFSETIEITATTSGGWANTTYTTTGEEGLLGTGHTARVYGDGSTTWVYDPTATTLSLPYFFNLPPAPELPILPVVLLAAVLLMILLKKRK